MTSISIRDKMNVAVVHFKDHNVLHIGFGVLHSDTTDEISEVVNTLFRVVCTKFNTMFARMNKVVDQEYNLACTIFDNYCNVQKVHTTLIIRVLEDGAKEENIYSVGDDLDVIFLG